MKWRSIFTQLIEEFHTQREQWILWLPVGIGLGSALYFSLPEEPSLHTSGALASLLATLAWVSHFRSRFIFWCSIMGFVVVSGLLLAQYRTISVAAPALTEPMKYPTWVRGTVDYVEARTSGHRMILSGVTMWKVPKEITPERVRLTINTPLNDAKPGDHISVKAYLSPPPAPVVPGGYDFARMAYFERIGAVGYSIAPVEVNIPAEPGGTNLRYWLEQLRFSVTTRIYKVISGEGQ
ncbi:MAG: DUF4131 domain-containing protein, partial [Alphaproteobacteria bacterium]|nr:DUF4131 domain-containing protein [Alphaproteobacteria bacterium]